MTMSNRVKVVPKSKIRLLIVEDDSDARWLMMRAFMEAGFQVDTAKNGEEGLGIFSKEPHQIVVTDLSMPNKHGHWLATELLKRELPPVVYVVTGVAEVKLFEDLKARGVRDIIQKPVNFDECAKTIMSFCLDSHIK